MGLLQGYRYWRIRNTKDKVGSVSHNDFRWVLHQLKFLDVTGDKVLHEPQSEPSSVFARSSIDTTPAARAFEDNDSHWSGDHREDCGEFIGYDFGAAVNVGGFRMKQYTTPESYGTSEVVVEASANNKDWMLVWTQAVVADGLQTYKRPSLRQSSSVGRAEQLDSWYITAAGQDTLVNPSKWSVRDGGSAEVPQWHGWRDSGNTPYPGKEPDYVGAEYPWPGHCPAVECSAQATTMAMLRAAVDDGRKLADEWKQRFENERRTVARLNHEVEETRHRLSTASNNAQLKVDVEGQVFFLPQQSADKMECRHCDKVQQRCDEALNGLAVAHSRHQAIIKDIAESHKLVEQYKSWGAEAQRLAEYRLHICP